MAIHSSIFLKNPMNRGVWVRYSPKGRNESDMTEHTHTNCILFRAFLVAQRVKLQVLPKMWILSPKLGDFISEFSAEGSDFETG